MARMGYSPKAVFQLLDLRFVQEFFERHLPKLAGEVDWTKDEFSRQTAIECYNNLPNDDMDKHRVGGDLEDIFHVFTAPSVYNDAVRQVGSALHGEVPEEVRGLTVENLVMWVYLNHDEAWRRLVHLTRATTLPMSQWHTYRLTPAQGKVIQAGFKLEALEAFKSDVSVLLKGRREGLAESVDVEISEVKGCEQLVCYISNNLRSQAQMEQGKKVDKTVNLPQEAYFRYSPEFQTLAIHYQGTRKTERKKLGEIFARRLKDAKCGDEIDESAQYRLNQLAQARQLTVPTHPDVREARVAEIGYHLPDGNILIFGTPENPDDARMALSEIINSSNCNLAVSEVFQVKIRVQLSDRFGRRSQQTLEIKKTGCDLEKKDAPVQEPLRQCLELWGIV